MIADDKFADAMARRAEELNEVFEGIPEAVWVPCPRGKHHINREYYPRCSDCERDDYDRAQERSTRGYYGRRRR